MSSPATTAPSAVTSVTGAPSRSVYAQLLQLVCGRLRQIGPERCVSTRLPISTSTTRMSFEVDALVLLGQHRAAQLADGAGRLHAGGAAPDDHERQQALAHRLVRLLLGRLERQQHALADLDRVAHVLEADGVLRPVVVTEEVGLRAGRHHQPVVPQVHPFASTTSWRCLSTSSASPSTTRVLG
jgi:hypothetical protein